MSNNNADSLNYFFNQANNDSLDKADRLKYILKAEKSISPQKNDSLFRINYFKIANRYYNIADLKNYKKSVELLIQKSSEAYDSISLGKAYNYMIDYYIKTDNPDSTYIFNSKAEDIYRKLKDNNNLAKSLLNKAILQQNEKDLLGSEKTVFEILELLRNSNDIALIYESNNLLGLTYGELSEYDLSKKYHDISYKIAQNDQIPPEFHFKSSTLNNLGLLYLNQKKYNIAIEMFESALKEKKLFEDTPQLYAMLLDNLAYTKFKVGNFKNLPALFYSSLKIRDSLKIVPGIIINKIHLSEYYALKRDTLKSIRYANEAYNLANENNEKRALLDVLKQLSNIDRKNAANYSKEYFNINDSLKIIESKTRNKFARIEFETEELTIEKGKLEERQKTLIYTGLGLLVIGIFIFVIRFQAAKNRELRLVQEQQQANEEIYQLMLNQQNKIEEVRQAEKKRIAQELHDGVLGKLFGTRMNLGVLNSKHDDKAVADRVGYIDELKTLEQEIREISHDLNSEKTAVFNNFVVMVTNFLDAQKTVCKADIRFSIDPKIEWNVVDNMAKINFYRILQEAFQNINKHADATNVNVTFNKKDSLIDLKIEDDGVGFNYARKKKGIGLQNMNARIESSGGTMQIETEIGNGTLLHFELPQTPIKTINLAPDEKNSPVVDGR